MRSEVKDMQEDTKILLVALVASKRHNFKLSKFVNCWAIPSCYMHFIILAFYE